STASSTRRWASPHQALAADRAAYIRYVEHIVERLAQPLDQQVDLGNGVAQGRRKADHVVGEGTENNAVGVSELRKPVGDAQSLVEFCLRLLVRDELNAAEHAARADVTDQRMIGQFPQPAAEMCA